MGKPSGDKYSTRDEAIWNAVPPAPARVCDLGPGSRRLHPLAWLMADGGASVGSTSNTNNGEERKTRGGVQKTKFAPNLAAASRRSTLAATTVVAGAGGGEGGKSASAGDATRSVEGRGRGRGGSRAAPSVPASRLLDRTAVSGPFAHGPASFRTARPMGPPPSAGVFGGDSRGLAAPGRARGARGVPTVGELDGPVFQGNNGEEEPGMDWATLLRRDQSSADHLPVNLLCLEDDGGRQGKKGTKMGGDDSLSLGAPKDSQRSIKDDQFIEGVQDLLEPQHLLLLQLPDCLPAINDGSDKVRPGEGVSAGPGVASLLSVGEKEKVVDLETFLTAAGADEQRAKGAATGASTAWPSSAEGHYGKLRVHASGRTSMLINGQVYWAVPSTVKTAAREVLHRAVAIDSDYGQSFDLGTVGRHLVFVPHIDQFLQDPELSL